MRLATRIIITVSCPTLLYLGCYALSWRCGKIDYGRILRGGRPIFAHQKWQQYMDGGSIDYQGLGYVVTKVHRFSYAPFEYEVGAQLHYQLKGLWPGFLDSRSDQRQTKWINEQNTQPCRWGFRGRT